MLYHLQILPCSIIYSCIERGEENNNTRYYKTKISSSLWIVSVWFPQQNTQSALNSLCHGATELRGWTGLGVGVCRRGQYWRSGNVGWLDKRFTLPVACWGHLGCKRETCCWSAPSHLWGPCWCREAGPAGPQMLPDGTVGQGPCQASSSMQNAAGKPTGRHHWCGNQSQAVPGAVWGGAAEIPAVYCDLPKSASLPPAALCAAGGV